MDKKPCRNKFHPFLLQSFWLYLCGHYCTDLVTECIPFASLIEYIWLYSKNIDAYLCAHHNIIFLFHPDYSKNISLIYTLDKHYLPCEPNQSGKLQCQTDLISLHIKSTYSIWYAMQCDLLELVKTNECQVKRKTFCSGTEKKNHQ